MAKRQITAEEAAAMISRNIPIEGLYVKGKLDIYQLGAQLNNDVIIQDCVIDLLHSPSVEYTKPVIIESSQIIQAVFNYAYFVDGLLINDSVFESYLDFEAGGHNLKEISIMGSTFKGFVSFFDCWFKNVVTIKDNHFFKGSNLLGNRGEAYQTHFDIPPVIINNVGKIDFNGEGSKQINTIDLR